MEQADIIEPLFERAKAENIPISKVCERAGVAPTTPSRWKTQGRAPNFGTLQKMTVALEELISERTRTASAA